MATYKLSLEAEANLEDIYYSGVVAFGLVQADGYFDGLVERFRRIADAPSMYPQVPHIREGYRRSVYGAHAIYYRIAAGHVFIVRIIKNQDTSGI